MANSLEEALGFTVSPSMLRRFLKKLGYSWKRFRKSLKKKQDWVVYQQKLDELKQLLQLYHKGYLDIFFGDESGFNMKAYVPYGWQPPKEYIHITPSKTKSRQVFGMMSLDNRLQAYTIDASVNSDIVIALIDDFHKTIIMPTVLVLDNAPIHHSQEFHDKIQEWQNDDLYIFFLPEYSPHLNPIEILWRMMKYQWIPYEKIDSQEELNQAIDHIICNFGEEYKIDFKEHHKKVSTIFE